METKTLHHEILEAERLIARNTLILQLHEQSVNQQKQITELTTQSGEMTAQIAELTKEKEPSNVD